MNGILFLDSFAFMELCTCASAEIGVSKLLDVTPVPD